MQLARSLTENPANVPC